MTKQDLETTWNQFKELSRDGQRTVASRLFGRVDDAWPDPNSQAIAKALLEVVSSEHAIEASLKAKR